MFNPVPRDPVVTMPSATDAVVSLLRITLPQSAECVYGTKEKRSG